MIEDRTRLRYGGMQYGAEPPPREGGAVPYALYDDRPWPTAGHAPPSGGRRPGAESGGSSDRYGAAEPSGSGSVSGYRYGAVESGGSGSVSGYRYGAAESGVSGYGGVDSGGYGAADSDGYSAGGANGDAYATADDEAQAASTELYAALRELDYRPSDSVTEAGAPVVGLIDLSAPRPLPVTHRGQRRRLAVVLVAVGIGVAIAGSAGYAVLRPGSSGKPAGAAAASAVPTEAPATNTGKPPETSPGPVHISLPSSASTTASTRPAAIAKTVTTGAGGAVATTAPARSSAPSPTASSGRPVVVVPAPTSPSAAPVQALTAAYSQMGANGPGRATGFVGTVQVSNPRDTDATDWTVRLTVPGGGEVTVDSGDVSVTQDGEAVTFRAGGTLAAHDSVTFTFGIDGPLPALPFGCTVDGLACS